MAKSDSEDLQRLEQAAAKQRHIESMTLPSQVSDKERALYQQRVDACHTQLESLQRDWDKPRRRLFTPPMTGQWRGTLSELELLQAEVAAQWEQHTADARSYSVVLARVHAEERRAMFSVNQLHRQGWNVSAIMPVASAAKSIIEESQRQAELGDYGAAVATLKEAYGKWESAYVMAQTALSDSPESMAELADSARRVDPDPEGAVKVQSDLATTLFLKKNTQYLAVAEQVRNQVAQQESQDTQTEDFVVQALQQLTQAAEECWRLHRSGVPVAAVMDDIDSATELVHLRPQDEETLKLVQQTIEKVNQLSNELSSRQRDELEASPPAAAGDGGQGAGLQ